MKIVTKVIGFYSSFHCFDRDEKELSPGFEIREDTPLPDYTIPTSIIVPVWFPNTQRVSSAKVTTPPQLFGSVEKAQVDHPPTSSNKTSSNKSILNFPTKEASSVASVTSNSNVASVQTGPIHTGTSLRSHRYRFCSCTLFFLDVLSNAFIILLREYACFPFSKVSVLLFIFYCMILLNFVTFTSKLQILQPGIGLFLLYIHEIHRITPSPETENSRA